MGPEVTATVDTARGDTARGDVTPGQAADAGAGAGAGRRGLLLRWCLPDFGAGRVAWLRVFVSVVVLLDVYVFTPGIGHGSTPDLYRPVFFLAHAHVPAPTSGLLQLLRAVLTIGALVAATGRWPRLAGWPLALSYILWDLYAMSYGKVDHDKVALIVAVLVLPTVGRTAFRDTRPDEAASFAVRTIQVAVVATYFLSACTKLKLGPTTWVDSAVFVWAISRRGNEVSKLLLLVPEVLKLSQWGLLALELSSPLLLFLRRRALVLGVGAYAVFHLTTWMAISIHFLPTAVCLTAFLALERLPAPRRVRWTT